MQKGTSDYNWQSTCLIAKQWKAEKKIKEVNMVIRLIFKEALSIKNCKQGTHFDR